jgi:hypothetical protein
MVIENFFIYYKKPAQYVYWGENYLDFYGVPGPGKPIKKIKTFDNVSLLDITPSQFQPIAREFPVMDTGVLLNSTHFIFNIFEFDKLPFQENLKKELVEWRLKKVFPENLDEYEHHFYTLKKTRVLSILIKKNIKDKIQQLFQENNIPLIYISNSTIEMINYMAKLGKSAPDFFIEIDKNITIVIFQERGLPYYIRKFRSDHAEDLVDEVIKTSKFVQNSYAKIPIHYSITADRPHSDLNFHLIHEELAKLQLVSRDIKERDQLFFAGKSS